ncbi:MAG: hypothetical protein R2851_20990 [Caldilineaceae bacterium]
MRIEDADKENIVRNLFLDHAQLVIDLEVAVQEYNTAYNNYDGIIYQVRRERDRRQTRTCIPGRQPGQRSQLSPGATRPGSTWPNSWTMPAG